MKQRVDFIPNFMKKNINNQKNLVQIILMKSEWKILLFSKSNDKYSKKKSNINKEL